MPLTIPPSATAATELRPSYFDASPRPPAAPPDTGIGPWPYAAAIGGQAADAASSLYNFDRGYGESNFGGNKAAALGTKAAIALLVPMLMHHIAKSNPGAAKFLGYATGVAGAAPAAYNLTRPDLVGR